MDTEQHLQALLKHLSLGVLPIIHTSMIIVESNNLYHLTAGFDADTHSEQNKQACSRFCGLRVRTFQ